MYVDPSVFDRQDLMVFYNNDWKRRDVLRVLGVEDVVFVTWKLDGGLSVQTWPKNRKRPVRVLTKTLGMRPLGHAFTEPFRGHKVSPADWRIMDALVDDPMIPFVDIVRKTGLSPKTVRKHLEMLIHDETIFIIPRLGSLSDSGDVVYHLTVAGKVGISELRRALGEALLIGDTHDPPMKYLLCKANDLADVTTRTRAVKKIPGVESAEVTLNRELLVAKDFVHDLLREKIRDWDRTTLSSES